MSPFELTCLAVVAFHLWRTARRGEYLALVLGAWIGEDSVIRAYGFYHYADSWTLWADQVPVLVLLIWPVVIQTARDVATAVRPGATLLAAGIVLADAAFIEPAAVDSGLWSWTHPGIFTVPPIGILGWALFSLPWLAGPIWLRRRPALNVLVAPALTHLALLALWWGLFRWVDHPVPTVPGVTVALLASAAIAWAARRHTLPPGALLTRAPAAAIFFSLLVRSPSATPALWGWAVAGSLPYLAMLLRHALTRGTGTQR